MPGSRAELPHPRVPRRDGHERARRTRRARTRQRARSSTQARSRRWVDRGGTGPRRMRRRGGARDRGRDARNRCRPGGERRARVVAGLHRTRRPVGVRSLLRRGRHRAVRARRRAVDGARRVPASASRRGPRRCAGTPSRETLKRRSRPWSSFSVRRFGVGAADEDDGVLRCVGIEAHQDRVGERRVARVLRTIATSSSRGPSSAAATPRSPAASTVPVAVRRNWWMPRSGRRLSSSFTMRRKRNAAAGIPGSRPDEVGPRSDRERRRSSCGVGVEWKRLQPAGTAERRAQRPGEAVRRSPSGTPPSRSTPGGTRRAGASRAGRATRPRTRRRSSRGPRAARGAAADARISTSTPIRPGSTPIATDATSPECDRLNEQLGRVDHFGLAVRRSPQ